MAQEPNYTLKEFIQKCVATPEEWREWESVSAAKPPGTKPMLQADPFYHELQPPSREYVRREELRAQFVADARERLLGGGWKISGRTGGPATRAYLEPADLKQAPLDFVRNTAGPFQQIQIHPGRAESNMEVLERFITTVCHAVGQPGKKVAKQVVQDLAQALCRDNYTEAAFLAAWEDAGIDPRWKAAGRR